MATGLLRKDAVANAFGVQLVPWEIAIYKFNDLIACHASVLIPFNNPEMVFLLQSPLVDEFNLFCIDVDKSIKEIRNSVVFSELFIDIQEMLKLMLVQCPTWGFPLGFNLGIGQGPEADGPTLEYDDLERCFTRLIEEFPF